MNNNLNEDVLDSVLSSAFAEYMDEEAQALPSKEELAKMYPIPKNGLKRIKRDLKRQRPKSKAMVYLKRVAIVLVAAITLFTGVLSLSTEVRSTVTEAIIGFFDKFARISFGNEDVEPTKVIEDVGDFEIGYIPEGLELINNVEEHDSRKITYMSDESEFLFITLFSSNSMEYAGDVEYSDYEPIEINKNEGHILYNDKERSGTLFFENNGYTVMISCILDKNELLKVAESIK